MLMFVLMHLCNHVMTLVRKRHQAHPISEELTVPMFRCSLNGCRVVCTELCWSKMSRSTTQMNIAIPQSSLSLSLSCPKRSRSPAHCTSCIIFRKTYLQSCSTSTFMSSSSSLYNHSWQRDGTKTGCDGHVLKDAGISSSSLLLQNYSEHLV